MMKGNSQEPSMPRVNPEAMRRILDAFDGIRRGCSNYPAAVAKVAKSFASAAERSRRGVLHDRTAHVTGCLRCEMSRQDEAAAHRER